MDDQARQAVFKVAELRRSKNLEKRKLVLPETKLSYVIYARKSTKGVDRQERSINDQLNECREYAKNNNLTYKESEILIEEESAKKSGKREVFDEMIKNIESGRYNGIIAWHPDRLARNMKDAGIIIDMIDRSAILDLKFPSYTFVNNASGKMALGIQFVLAKQYSDTLSDTTKRGTSRTADEGKYMGKNKFGYKPDVSNNFRKDPDTYEIVKESWKLALSGHSLSLISEHLREKRVDLDIKQLSTMFNDTFYAGVYLFGDRIVDLSKVDVTFEPMVTCEEFLEVQQLLCSRKFTKNKVKELIFRHFVICGYCGKYMVPAKSKGRNQTYLYLNCKNLNCVTNKSKLHPSAIRGKDIYDFILKQLKETLNVSTNLYNHSIKKYHESVNEEVTEIDRIIRKIEQEIRDLELRIGGKESGITDGTSLKVRELIQQDINRLYEEKVRLLEELDKQKYSRQVLLAKQKVRIPSYKGLVNRYKIFIKLVEGIDDQMMLDEVVKCIYLNLTVKDRKVSDFQLNEPFKSYKMVGAMKNGVDEGI